MKNAAYKGRDAKAPANKAGTTGKKPIIGRPTKYRKELCAEVRKLCEGGFTDLELSDHLRISKSTLNVWKALHPEFLDSLKTGKEIADTAVERALYSRAIGYSVDSVKIMQDEGVPLIVPYREHYPPDSTAAIFWLKNRKPANWREKLDHEHTIKSVSINSPIFDAPKAE